MRARDIAGYLFLAVVWGLSFVVLLHVVDAFGWAGGVSFRALTAAAALLLAALVRARKLDFGFGWRHVVMIGATTVAGQLIGLAVATPRIGTAMTAIIVATIPLFAMLMAQVWGLERVTGERLAGLFVGFAGIVLLVGFPAVPITQDFVIGCLACLAGALASAFGSNYANAYLRDVGAFEVTIGSFISGGLMTLPLLLVVPVPTTPQPVDYGYLLIIGGVMSALCYLVYFNLVAAIGATRAISVEFGVTVVAVVIGALLLGEPLTPPQLVGGVVIIVGCALVLGLVPRRRR